MRKRFFVSLCVLWLTACQNNIAKPGVSTTPSASATPLPTAAPPAPTAVPTPTSLAEGLTTRLVTPDPAANCPAHYPWFFENQASECAAMLLNTWAVLQPFEHGLMVWFQEGGRTVVFTDDGSLFKPYQEVNDPSTLPLPGPDPNIAPPAGFYQPELGFAKFWRGLTPGSEWIRPQLGWATAPEQAYSAFWQCNTAQGSAARCYFNGPRDEIIVMTSGGAQYWNYWQRPVR